MALYFKIEYLNQDNEVLISIPAKEKDNKILFLTNKGFVNYLPKIKGHEKHINKINDHLNNINIINDLYNLDEQINQGNYDYLDYKIRLNLNLYE